MEPAERYLWQKIAPLVNPDYIPKTRIHPLGSYSDIQTTVFCKREDETGFAIGGTKFRKYAALIPYLKRNGYTQVGIIGGAYANNPVAALQLCIENKIKAHLFLRGESALPERGNLLLLKKLCKEKDSITWVSRAEWASVNIKVQSWADKAKQRGIKSFCVLEGAAVTPAVPGVCTLMLDILRNERSSGRIFPHIILDSGTGMTAAITILVNQWLIEKSSNTELHNVSSKRNFSIVLTAGDVDYFTQELKKWHSIFCMWLGVRIDLPTNYTLLLPNKKFGRLHNEDQVLIKKLAISEGIIIDSVYGCPLFGSINKAKKGFYGDILVVHGGGGVSVLG